VFSLLQLKAQTRELHFEDDDLERVEAMIKHMYGAGNIEVLSFIRAPSKGLRDLLGRTLDEDELDQIESELKEDLSGQTVCYPDQDPKPWQSQLAAEISVQLVCLYGLADKFELSGFKDMLLSTLAELISTAWNHSDVLSVIDEIVHKIREDDTLYVWLLEEMQQRLRMLLGEYRFEAYIATTPELEGKIGSMSISMLTEELRAGSPRVVYCYYSSDQEEIHCRRNVTLQQEPGRQVCSNCGQSKYISAERKRLWKGEDERRHARGVAKTARPPA